MIEKPQLLNPDLNMNLHVKINTFDIDGCIFINSEIGGIHPGPEDVIITGRSYEESPETEAMLLKRGIHNKVFYNSKRFDEKTRESSGEHKAVVIRRLLDAGYKVKAHFEDDPIQASVIKAKVPEVEIIMIVHQLTELENVRHGFP